MPTRKELHLAKRQEALAAEGDFKVYEVIECVSSGEEGYGDEDLIQDKVTKAEASKEAANAVASRAYGGKSMGSQVKTTGRTISQDTFNEAVRENQEEFESNLQEAIAETVTEFELIGVDLSGIDKSIAYFSAGNPESATAAAAVDSGTNSSGAAVTSSLADAGVDSTSDKC